ncbi:hypothetical protein KFK09_003592 [Dendrobium nobile]|uniref:Uncharacterized protein n=1 Tax=Dendrobium nobile TaxID=94219 RepID=A0A8T3C3X5_DENNO|nr:hypothetical protein KFK09_003592 [Dendrobium nobile]
MPHINTQTLAKIKSREVSKLTPHLRQKNRAKLSSGSKGTTRMTHMTTSNQ